MGSKNSPSFSREFSEESFANMADALNTLMGTLLIGENFGGQVVENIELPVGEEVRISHNLKITPKYRIILRQKGELIITDGDSQWTDKYIYLRADFVSGSSGVSFTQDLNLHNNNGIAPALPSDGTTVGNGYNLNGSSVNSYNIIRASDLNISLTQSSSSDEKVIATILIMRG